MSRIGQKPITIDSSVKIDVKGQLVSVTGPKGVLTVSLPTAVKAELVDGSLVVTRNGSDKQTKAYHGLSRSLLNNAVSGVTEGFTKELELVGTGYRVAAQGGNLVFSLGFSHPINFTAVPGITFAVDGNNKLKITGIDKQLVGQVAANIRKLRPPEPYKGKGIRYVNEVIRRKAGKAAAKGA